MGYKAATSLASVSADYASSATGCVREAQHVLMNTFASATLQKAQESSRCQERD
jgi:hypothetical protein